MDIVSLREAAEDGNDEAQCLLGRIYLGLIDLKAEKAAKLFFTVAIKGYYSAQYSQGICYEEGMGVEQNLQTCASAG